MCPTQDPPGRTIDKYTLYHEIAAGGMATVHLARLRGKAGFARTVAVKRLHPTLAKDPDFVAMFLDEARLAGRINHPNVVSTLEVIESDGEIFLVMDYVHGDALSRLLRAARETGQSVDPKIVAAVMAGVLHGLHAAHEARSEQGDPLGIVHRDVSPQNVLVGTDGIPRVVDFGVAKAKNRAQTTQDGQIKGKLRYMSPEQLRGDVVDRRSDVFAAATVAWEAFAGVRLIESDEVGAIAAAIFFGNREPPSKKNPLLSARVDEIVMRGLERDLDKRYPTARDFAVALEEGVGAASASHVGEWVTSTARAMLADRVEKISEIESASATIASVFPRAPRHLEEVTVLDARAGDASSVSLSAPVVRAPGGRKGLVIALACGVAVAGLGLAVGAKLTRHATQPASRVTAEGPVAPSAPPPAADGADASPIAASSGAPIASASAPLATATASAPRATPRVPPRRAGAAGPPRAPANTDPPAAPGDENLFRERR